VKANIAMEAKRNESKSSLV